MKLSATEDGIVFYLIGMLGVGVVCLFQLSRRICAGKADNPSGKVQAWSIRWTDFGLLIWLMFMSVVVIQMIFGSFFGQTEAEPGVVEETWENIIAGSSMQIGLLAVFLLYRKSQPQLFHEKFNNIPMPLGKALSNALFIFFASFPAVWIVGILWLNLLHVLENAGIEIAHEPQNVVRSFSEVKDPLPLFMLGFLAIIGAPIVEELIFRGVIYRFLKFRMRTSLAIITSALLFAGIHLNFISFSPLFVLGIFLCISYEMSGNLKVPIFFHALFNLNSIILIQYQTDEISALAVPLVLIR